MDYEKVKDLAYKAGFEDHIYRDSDDKNNEISATGEYGCGELMQAFADLVEENVSSNGIDNNIMEIVKAVAYIGCDFGYGEYGIAPDDPIIEKARHIYDGMKK